MAVQPYECTDKVVWSRLDYSGEQDCIPGCFSVCDQTTSAEVVGFSSSDTPTIALYSDCSKAAGGRQD